MLIHAHPHGTHLAQLRNRAPTGAPTQGTLKAQGQPLPSGVAPGTTLLLGTK